MKKLLGIVVLGLLLSSNAYAKKIKLVCVDNEEDAVFNIKINTSNKTVIVDGRTESIKITEDEFVECNEKTNVPFILLGHVTKGKVVIDDEHYGFINEFKEKFDLALEKRLV